MLRHAALLVTLVGSPAVEAPRVSLDGYGSFRIGMSEREATQAAGQALIRVDPESETPGCFYATAPQLPEGISLMFLDGRLARVDVFEPEVATTSGAKIGTTERQLNKMYGPRLDQQPHKYDWPVGHYITLLSSSGSRGVRFETDGTRVTGFYAGTAEALELTEGCQ